MTVAELIEQLKGLPQDHIALVEYYDVASDCTYLGAVEKTEYNEEFDVVKIHAWN